MPNTDYGELFCQAVDTILQERLNELSFDQTIVCTIIDNSNKANGIYRVSNGSAKFDAYSSDTTYSNNTNVYVQIPRGDWSEQKIILSKKPDDVDKPISYVDPFDSFVDITGNVITQTPKSFGLLANNKDLNDDGIVDDEPINDRVVIWSYNCPDSSTQYKENGPDLAGYTRLGIKASFQAWLKELGAVKGSYGLRLRIEAIPEDELGLNKDGVEIEPLYYDLTFDCGEMPGNPYNFESFYQQEKLFDISSFYKIRKMELEFYEISGSFVNNQGQEIPWENLPPNIFVKDIYISLGYDSNSFDTDTIIIYSLDSSQYIATEDPPEDNHKKLEVRWIHKMDNGYFKSIDLKDEINYELTWYRKELGSRSDNAYSGVDWKPLSRQISNNKNYDYPIIDNDWIEYNGIAASSTTGLPRYPGFNYSWLIPDITRAEEQIKAILIYNDQPYYSDILSFTNRKEVVSKPTVDAIQALSINCEDNSYGNYLVYNLGGQLIDTADASIIREFKAYFNSALDDTGDAEETASQLTEAESIEWIIPTTNTMIVLDDDFISGNTEDNYIDDNGFYHIFRYGEKNNKYNIVNQNTQRYKIKGFYTQTYSNNTIKCVIIKDKITYTAVKELTFGPAGTSGTDYTFILDFDNGETALTLQSDFETGETIPAVFARARLYDFEGKEIEDLKSKNIVWSWEDETNSLMKFVPQQDRNDKVELQLTYTGETVPTNNYSILKATLKKSTSTGDGGWGDFDLHAYLPIPIRSSRKYQFISGTTYIVYNSLGYLDTYYMNPYQIHINNGTPKEDKLPTTVDSTWEIFSSVKNDPYIPKLQVNNTNGQTYIRPINIYVEDSMNDICVVGSADGGRVWSQPIYAYQNKYPSSIINDWNGKLTIDNENNAILAAKVAAGKKERDNTFSGVMMGDWSGNDSSSADGAITSNTGIYGFQKGIASFGFRDNGTAFIGKPGAGRLEFDGNKSIIESNAFASGLGGLSIDFDDGLIEMYKPDQAHDKKRSIILDADAKNYPFTIGENFQVKWDGSIEANNGEFSGEISASEISGTDIYTSTLHGDDGLLKLDGYLNVNDDMYIGHITGMTAAGVSTNLYGIVVTAGGGTAIECNGKNIRIGNNSGSDSLILKGNTIRWHTNGIVGTGEGYSHSRFLLKADSIEFTCDADNQHGIYARFA